MRKNYNKHPEYVFFMVGDNPRADIKGANLAGWGSFLTKTGVHKK
jgi:ribonucleotide monophosphatase NagD (HAD superfamily)